MGKKENAPDNHRSHRTKKHRPRGNILRNPRHWMVAASCRVYRRFDGGIYPFGGQHKHTGQQQHQPLPPFQGQKCSQSYRAGRDEHMNTGVLLGPQQVSQASKCIAKRGDQGLYRSGFARQSANQPDVQTGSHDHRLSRNHPDSHMIIPYLALRQKM